MMKPETHIIPKPDPVAVTLTSTTIRGKRYGASPVVVHLFGAEVDAFAALAGDEKYICQREQVAEWLEEHGLTEYEAELLLELAEVKQQLPSTAVLRFACNYLNADMLQHHNAGHDWRLDPGKLQAALEAGQRHSLSATCRGG